MYSEDYVHHQRYLKITQDVRKNAARRAGHAGHAGHAGQAG